MTPKSLKLVTNGILIPFDSNLILSAIKFCREPFEKSIAFVFFKFKISRLCFNHFSITTKSEDTVLRHNGIDLSEKEIVDSSANRIRSDDISK